MKLAALLCMAFCPPATVSLIRAEAPMRLTLREAVEIGLRPGNRADTALAGEATARAESNARTNKNAMLPLVEMRVSGGERSVNLATQGFGGLGGAGGPQLNQSFTTFDSRPVTTFTLLNLGQWRAWKASQVDIGRAAKEQDWAKDSAALGIANQYVACLRASAEVAAAQADLQLSQELLKAAELRLSAGTVTAVDVTRARAQAAADRSNLGAQQQAEREARAALFRAIGADHTDHLELAPLADTALLPKLTLAGALEEAVASRADLRAREEALRAAGEKVKAVAWEKFPSISGSFDIGRNGNTPANLEWTRTGTLGLNLTLFDFGRRGERESQASIAFREERIRLVDLRREIDRQVRVALGRVESAEAQVEAARAELTLSNLQIDQVRQRLDRGLATGLDVSEAQTRLARSTRSLLHAEYGVQSAGLELMNATGTLRGWIEGETSSRRRAEP